MNQNKNILVLTHNFPRFPSDVSAPGFMPLYRSIHGQIPLEFLTPHDVGLNISDNVEGMKVNRFRYGSDENETLAYRGDMHKRVFANPLTSLRFYRSFKQTAHRIAEQTKPLAIWAQWWIPGGVIGASLSREMNIPLIVSCHGTDIALLSKSYLFRMLAKKVFTQASSITVVSHFLKDQIVSLLSSQVENLSERMMVAPLPVNVEAFYYDETIEPDLSKIVAATRYTTQKRHDVLIDAVAKLRDEGINCFVDLYGSGPERGNLQSRIESCSLGNIIRLNDSITHSELADKYRTSGISLLISEREGFGLTLVEAMLCGCAVIGAKSGGITDIIEQDGREGLLVPPGDIGSLASALKSLLTNQTLRKELSERGRISCKERFSETVIARRYLEILQK